MAKLYTNENVPLPVAEEPRRLGHDVMTVQESGLGGQSVPDHAVLTFAIDWFLSLDEARAVTEAWRGDFNRVHPHGALGNRAASKFARPAGTASEPMAIQLP